MNKSRGCAYSEMPGELVRKLVEASASWPEGPSGELEGVVRVLGGGRVLLKLKPVLSVTGDVWGPCQMDHV